MIIYAKRASRFFVLEEQQYMAFGSPNLCSWNKDCPLTVYMYTIYTAHWPIMNTVIINFRNQKCININTLTNKNK